MRPSELDLASKLKLSGLVSYAISTILRKIRPPNIKKSQKSVKNQLKKLGQMGKSDKQDSPENQELETSRS